MRSTTDDVTSFISDYAEHMNSGVQSGTVDGAFLARCFAEDFIGASPAGVMAARNEGLADILTRSYRAMGGTAFVAEDIEVEELAPQSYMATVGWRFDYRRPADGEAGAIRFTNHYFVNTSGGDPKIFAWITPDEQAALREHGLVPASS